MLLEQTIDKLNQMKLFGMASALKDRLARADHRDLPVSDLIGLIVDDEWLSRENRKLISRLQGAKFKEKDACIENIDYRKGRSLTKQKVLELAQHRWIDASQNIAITGPAGVGKSYLAQALGHHACMKGYSVQYLRVPKLTMQMLHARADGSYTRWLAKIAKTKLLILDDFGLAPLEECDKRDLLEILEDRYGTGATIVTSQLPVASWYEYLGGGRLGDAICDRLHHNAHRVELTGESLRKELRGLTSDAGSDK